MDQRWLTISAVFKYASLSRKTVYKMLLNGDLRGRKTKGDSGHWRVDKDSIDEWFMQGEKKALAICQSLGLRGRI